MKAAVARAITASKAITTALLWTRPTQAPLVIKRVQSAITRTRAPANSVPRPAIQRERAPPPRFPRSAAMNGTELQTPLLGKFTPRWVLRWVVSQFAGECQQILRERETRRGTQNRRRRTTAPRLSDQSAP